MPRDVDLSSKEWCDLVFEGKNKEFGAYELRTTSTKRHNKAVIYTIVGALLIAAGLIGFLEVQQLIAERNINDNADQEEVLIDMDQADEPEPEEQKVEIKQPEVLPEEVLNTVKVTELKIVEDEKVQKKDEIKSVDETKEEVRAFGNVDNDKGTDDRNVTRELKNEIVVEEKRPEPPKKEEVVKKEEVKEEKPVKEEVFKSVEQMPTFPGGDAALMKFLSSHIQYPTMAQENGIQGKVIVQFVVGKDGKVGEVKVARSVDKELDKEAVRVCKSLPKFVPGRQNGQAVSVWYTLPVTFKLQNAN